MRRTICLLPASFAAGVYLSFHMGIYKFLPMIFLCVLAAVILNRMGCANLKKSGCIVMLFFVAGASCFFLRENAKNELIPYVGEQVSIEGEICSIQKKDADKYQLIIKTDERRTKVLVNMYGDAGVNYGNLAGRHAVFSGKIELPAERRNPKTFDYRLYLRTKGIRVFMSINQYDMEITDARVNLFTNVLSNIRCDFAKKISEVMKPENAGILIGMLFGDKAALSDDTYEMFQKNGTAHILAVSGIHVGIIYLWLGRLLKARRNIFINLLLLFCLFLYAALAAFSPSVLRAGGMIALHIISKLLCMRYDMLCAGSGIALLMMFVNPFVIFDVGFLLSFIAIFTIAVVVPAAFRIYNSDVTALVALQLGMAPASAYLFNYFSAAAFFINIPVIMLAGILIPVGVALIPLSYIFEPLFSVCAGFADALCGILYIMNEVTYSQGKMFFNVVSPPLWLLFIFYGMLFCGCSEAAFLSVKRKEIKRIAASAILIVFVSVTFTVPFQDNFHRAQLIFVDVGQGDCLHIRTPGGKNILIDGGGNHNFDVGKKTLMPYLLKNGVSKIDMAFVSHRHLDHYGGIVSLAENFKVDKVCFYEANQAIEPEILKETGLEAKQLVYLARGQNVEIDRGVWVEILYPERKTADDYVELTADDADENDISLIMKLHYYGFSVLMTGDINSEGEAGLIEAQKDESRLKCDILKVAHHGSKYSSSDEFIAAVRPSVAVFQVGKNNYGHPTTEVLEKCDNINAEIYRNDRQGAIVIFLKKGKKAMDIKTIIPYQN